jgi:hypothetical protein
MKAAKGPLPPWPFGQYKDPVRFRELYAGGQQQTGAFDVMNTIVPTRINDSL